MDPLSLVLGALASGAAKGFAENATDAVKAAYHDLKQRVSRRFAGSNTAEVALAAHADDPTTWQAPLAKALTESGACADAGIIETAQRLMELLDDVGARTGKYHVDLSHAQGVQVGDDNRQLNVFTTPPTTQ